VKLLLVEDDAAMRATLERSLARRGVTVVTCADGDRALDRWRASVPDVVMLDLSLPGRDGLQVLAQARGEGLTTPVLILTARGTVGDRILGLNTGADDYLPKPFDLDELEARVRALARRGQPMPMPALCARLSVFSISMSGGMLKL
jgi:two-component system response regulator TctD